MTRFLTIFAVILTVAFGATAATVDQEPISAVVSILPQREIVVRIGGEHVNVTVLIPPGRSPATFEPSPRLMASVSDADLLLPLGLPFERTVIARIHDIEPDLAVCQGSPTVDVHGSTSSAEAVHHDSLERTAHDHSDGSDPHFWLDPRLTIEYSHQVRQCLCTLRPTACSIFSENLERYVDDLNAADRRIMRQLTPLAGRTLMVFHPAFGHFAKRYGLRQVAIEFEGKNPTGRHLAEVIERAKLDGVKVLFIQPQFAGSGAHSVASAIGADVVELDPLAPDLLANLEKIATLIVSAFDAQEEAPQ